MNINISGSLKADTEAIADTYIAWFNTNYPSRIQKLDKHDAADALAAGIFPAAWAVNFWLLFTSVEFTAFKNAFNDVLDNHANKIFNFSANSSHE